MSRLNDVLAEAVEAERKEDGSVDLREAYKHAEGRFDRDDELILICEASLVRMKDIASRGRAAIMKQAAGQGEFPFPDIRRGYAIDTDGRKIKNTDALMEAEFARLIAIREKQMVDDRSHLDALKDAYQTCKPIWGRHPNWTFGRCCEEIMKRAAKGRAA